MNPPISRSSCSLGTYAPIVQKALDDWRSGDKTRRLWSGDTSLWSRDDEDRWLGWLNIVDQQRKTVGELERLRDDVRQAGFQHILLLGMGGSSLAPEVWQRTFGSQPGCPWLHVLDSTCPDQVRAVDQRLDLRKTLVVVASKSGGTIEPNMFKQYFFERVRQAVGEEEPGSRFMAITDPGTKMNQIAEHDGFRHIVFGLPTIGGRFSALSNFGLAPLAMLGVDVGAFLVRAAAMVQACGPDVPPDENPGVQLGVLVGTLALQGRDKLTIVASPGLASLGGWLEQLIAESTGKSDKGIVPVDGEPLGPPEVYGTDRLFVYERLAAEPSAEQDRAVEQLAKAGHPVVRIDVADTLDLGQEMFRWEIATAVMGSLLEINPFNQPDVEAAKVAARNLTAAFEQSGQVPAQPALVQDGPLTLYADESNAAAISGTGAGTVRDCLAAHLARLGTSDYFAINAYVEMNEANATPLAALRQAVRDARHVATTLGYGPRFLHSTGQLHKGGPQSGVFLQITCDDAADLPIPGQKFTFGILKTCQALGDFEVLAKRERRVLGVHITGDVATGLATLAAMVRQAMG